LLRELIEDQFGPLPAPAVARLEQLSPTELTSIGKAIRTARSLRDLGLDE
jgi:hypothetical protein